MRSETYLRCDGKECGGLRKDVGKKRNGMTAEVG